VQSNAICRNALPICEGVAADMLAAYRRRNHGAMANE